MCTPPAETWVTPERPATLTGVGESVLLPLPSWPNSLCPQHFTLPFAMTAQVCSKPAETETATGGGAAAGAGEVGIPTAATTASTTARRSVRPPIQSYIRPGVNGCLHRAPEGPFLGRASHLGERSQKHQRTLAAVRGAGPTGAAQCVGGFGVTAGQGAELSFGPPQATGERAGRLSCLTNDRHGRLSA